MMDARDPRDLDGVIDDVARAMTAEALARDLRPGIAARIATRPAWAFGWRIGLAAAAVAAVVLAAVFMWPGHEPQRPRAVAVSDGAPYMPARATVAAPDAVETTTAVDERLQGARRPITRVVARQTIVDAPASEMVVDIAPLAVVPFEADPLQPLEQVAIAPIEIEPVGLSQLELVE